ncbi:MAG: hypothetical protein E6387_03935 [Veillonella sp.]|nr:hypothetical protein [Veillonella sp.]
MAEVVKKQFKSKYHILIWIAVLSLIFMGMVEYGYVTGGHWYVYFLKALKSFLGFWGGYISLVAMFIALIFAILYLTPWVGNMTKSVSRKKAIWIHRLNLVAIIAANIHVHGFGRLSKMVPFLPVFDVVTYALVIYYIYWMFKQK